MLKEGDVCLPAIMNVCVCVCFGLIVYIIVIEWDSQ